MKEDKSTHAFEFIKEKIDRDKGASLAGMMAHCGNVLGLDEDQFQTVFSVFASVIYKDSEDRFHFIDDAREQIDALVPAVLYTPVCPCCGHELAPGATVSIPKKEDMPAKQYRSGKGAYERVIAAINALPDKEPLFFRQCIDTLSEAMPSESPGVIRTALLGIYKTKKYSKLIDIGEALGDDNKYHKTWGRL